MTADASLVIDEIDRRIIRSLVEHGRASVSSVSAQVSLSASATSERIRRLETKGIIAGYRAVVSPEAIGRPFDAVIGARARPGADRAALEAWVAGQTCVVEAMHLTGAHDYLIRARCRDSAELDTLLMAMKRDGGVDETETRIVLRQLDVHPCLL